MDASTFYEMWNNSVESDVQLEPLNVFGNAVNEPDESDDLLSLLLDDDLSDNLDNSVNLGKDTVTIKDTEVTENVDYNSKDIFCYRKRQKEFVKTEKVISVNPLYDSIQEFCKQYDYSCEGSIIKLCELLTGKVCSENEAYTEILHSLFHIVVDTDFDESLLNFSFTDIEDVIPLYRNFYLSELITVAGYKNMDSFDGAVIKYFSLEKRDTGLLLQLMNNSIFDREEAIIYTVDLDMFNSYLSLKLSNKFDKSLFDDINAAGINLNSYTKSILCDNPWAFLATNNRFEDILQITKEADIPLDLAKAFADNKWIYYIIKAYAAGVYSREFIDSYLVDDNPFAEIMAEEYAENHLDQQALAVYSGDYYVAKFIYDVKALTDDCTPFLERAASFENGKILYDFAHTLLGAVYENILPESEWYKFVYLVGVRDDIELLQAYNVLAEKQVLAFNQFCFKLLIKSLGVDTEIPTDIGSLLLFQRGESLSYANSQIVAECFDKFIESIKGYMSTGQHVCILPANTGLLICSPDYNSFVTEQEKFKLFAKCKSSLDRAVEDGATEKILKYNITRLTSIMYNNGYTDISKSFESLINSPAATYLLFDDLLDVIVNKLPEFIGLCRSTNAISLLKYLYSIMNTTNKAVIQIEFLKTVLTRFFGNRISFERYTENTVLPITVVEVHNSNLFSSETYSKVMYRFDDFIADLNRKNKIICRFSELSKIVITGV